MNYHLSFLFLGALSLLSASHSLVWAAEPVRPPVIEERNYWPLYVEREESHPERSSWQSLGPIIFNNNASTTANQSFGVRPFYLQRSWDAEKRTETDLLYPLFVYRTYEDRWNWSIFGLINRSSPTPAATQQDAKGFDLWPFYFSRDSGNSEDSYRAVFPLYGAMRHRLGYEQLEWTLFPLYGSSLKRGKQVRAMPWPFVKVISGGAWHGWALWPLAGWQEERGKSRSQYYLWPLIYKDESGLSEPKPSTSLGFLPFYSSDITPEYVSRNYVWPFFGHTLRTAPYKYEETRYLWPFFLQARGDQRLRNRWAPFYSRSEIKGVSKTWVAWPLWRRETFTEAGLDQRKTQFLYVIYWNLEQRRPGQSPDAPVARKTHLWPLFSSWNNGAGQRQIQFLSPLEVFMQSNDTVRQAYTPLFALYRFNQPKPGDLRHSLLWNAISYERSQSAQRRAFHFGPLFSSSSAPEEKRIAFLAGLLAFNKGDALSSWKIKFFDFKKKADKTAASSP